VGLSNYRLDLENAIRQHMAGQGDSFITQEQLCERLGRKVTSAFRRRMAEMQTEGLVTRCLYRTERGGYKVGYILVAGKWS